ncbi:isoprenoid synthase domain-containing protein [Aspergillus undulatus]|uniref:isoprenoid synthase domain-containing protein n=1 Tax=Aspergillus undulatus TaxID=1810928 RepID=UPI003CCD60DF
MSRYLWIALGLLEDIQFFCLHPSQLGHVFHLIYKRNDASEFKFNGQYLTESQKICFHFLDQTGRSYSAVIKQLHRELLLSVAIFYLILRGLDTMEDDPSLEQQTKVSLLRDFKDTIEINDWTFHGNRPEEKDRDLVVHFHNVLAEYRDLKPAYQAIIREIADKMGNGMADYAFKPAIKTVSEYDDYCFYVAGLVGEGLTRLFVESGLIDSVLLQHSNLHRSMGLLLQKTYLNRDVHEDHNDLALLA